jgi:hypothetical protein
MDHCKECQCVKCHDRRAKQKEWKESVRWVSYHSDGNDSGRFLTVLRCLEVRLLNSREYPIAYIDKELLRDNYFPEIFKDWAHWQKNKELYLRASKLSTNKEKLKEFFNIKEDYPLYGE